MCEGRRDSHDVIIRVVPTLALFGLSVALAQTLNSEVQQPEVSTLVRVEAQYVCMPNDKYLKKVQTPVRIEGKTYYACCQMCEKMLHMDPKTRIAVDPVSEKVVDKATAVIGALADGTVYYFENEENMNRFEVKAPGPH